MKIELELEIGPNLMEAIDAMASCSYYIREGGLGAAIQEAFGIDFSKYLENIPKDSKSVKVLVKDE